MSRRGFRLAAGMAAVSGLGGYSYYTVHHKRTNFQFEGWEMTGTDNDHGGFSIGRRFLFAGGVHWCMGGRNGARALRQWHGCISLPGDESGLKVLALLRRTLLKSTLSLSLVCTASRTLTQQRSKHGPSLSVVLQSSFPDIECFVWCAARQRKWFWLPQALNRSPDPADVSSNWVKCDDGTAFNLYCPPSRVLTPLSPHIPLPSRLLFLLLTLSISRADWPWWARVAGGDEEEAEDRGVRRARHRRSEDPHKSTRTHEDMAYLNFDAPKCAYKHVNKHVHSHTFCTKKACTHKHADVGHIFNSKTETEPRLQTD
jgi:hypothetical protein